MCLICPLIGSIHAFNPLSRFANIYLAAFARNLIKYSIFLSWGHGHIKCVVVSDLKIVRAYARFTYKVDAPSSVKI